MAPVPYVPEKHYSEILTWSQARRVPAVPEARLPVNGFIVPGIAVAFFYCTDSETAIFEYCIANPDAPREEQYAAIRVITAACFARATELGYQHMTCLTPVPGIIDFAKRIPGARFEARGTDTFLETAL